MWWKCWRIQTPKQTNNFDIKNNIKHQDAEEEQREDAITAAATQNIKMCGNWMETIKKQVETKEEKKDDKNGDINIEAVEVVVTAFECVDAANLYLSHQIAACEMACDAEVKLSIYASKYFIYYKLYE